MILAIDIGGTKTLIALFDDLGDIIRKKQILTLQNYKEFTQQLFTVIRKNFWEDEISHIGLAVPGMIDYTNNSVIKLGNLPWGVVDLRREIEEEFHAPTVIDNDANVGSLYASVQLHPTPASLLYVTIGTGIGTGITYHGKISKLLSHSEGGHTMITYRGKLTAWEEIASGRAITRDFGKFASEITDVKIWGEIAWRIGLGLLAILPTLQPEAVVFGGGIGTHYGHFKDQLQKILQQELPDMVKIPAMSHVLYPEEAVVYGCYILAKQNSDS